MEKIIKGNWYSKLLILVMTFVMISLFTGCALRTENETNKDAIDASENEINDASKEEIEDATTKEANNSDKNTTTKSTEEVISEAYIKGIDTERKEVTMDWIELLFSTDEERLKEIGMKSDDLVTGFYIYNEEEKDDLLSFDENVVVELLEDTTLTQVGLTELEERIKEQAELFRITMKDNVVLRISQIYLP